MRVRFRAALVPGSLIALETRRARVRCSEREAKVLAALNHANIAALFGMEESSGRHSASGIPCRCRRERNRDIDPTGKRFIAPVSVDQSGPGTADAREIRVVINWFEELRQRVPVP